MRKSRFMNIFILLFFISCLVCTTFVYAGISVDPVIVEIVVEKGKERPEKISVTNTGTGTVNVRIRPGTLRKDDRSIKDWINFQIDEFVLKPEEKKDFSYTVIPPDDVTGELRGRITFVVDEIEKKSSVGIMFGVPVYAVVQNTIKFDVSIKDINILYDPEKNIISGSIVVDNKSNVHIRPSIDWSIENIGTGKKSVYILSYGQAVQKETLKPFDVREKSIRLSPGKYKIGANVDYGKMYGLEGHVVTKETELEINPVAPR